MMTSAKTISKDIDNAEVCKIVQEILNWKSFNDNDKRYFIQSFLLNWVGVEDIKHLTNVDKQNCEVA